MGGKSRYSWRRRADGGPGRAAARGGEPAAVAGARRERRAIERRIEGGRLHPVSAGVYAVGHRVLSQHGRWMAAVLAAGPGAVLSHRSAAALWGIRPTARARVEVTTPKRLHPSARTSSSLRRSPAGRDDDVPRHPGHDRAQDPPRPRRGHPAQRARPGAERGRDPPAGRAAGTPDAIRAQPGHRHPPNPPPQCPPFAAQPHGGRVPRLHPRTRDPRAGDQHHHRGTTSATPSGATPASSSNSTATPPTARGGRSSGTAHGIAG